MLKRSIDIELEEKLTKKELENIAKRLTGSHQRTFIGYRLKGKTEGPYWATTHSNPKLEVKILGIPKGKTFPKSKRKGKRIGQWINELPQQRLAIIKTSKGYLLESTYLDGSSDVEKLKKRGGRYIPTNEPTIYYKINKGNLESWNKSERFSVALPLK